MYFMTLPALLCQRFLCPCVRYTMYLMLSFLKNKLYQRERLFILLIYQVPVVQSVDSTIHSINHNPCEKSISYGTTYPVESDSSGSSCSKPD